MSDIYIGLTGKQMCEAIVEAGFLNHLDGRKLTGEEVWNSSPSGELFQVFEWYLFARDILRWRFWRDFVDPSVA